MTVAEAVRQNRIRDLRAQLEGIDRQLKDKQQEDGRLRTTIAEYQAKVDVVPTRESELVELTRDYATLQTSYSNLLTKREDSKLAANLERRQYGEQFRVLDAASLPEKPFNRMNRILVTGGGAVGGLLLGLTLVGFFEFRDSSFKTDADVLRVLTLPVLATVPALVSDAERRSHQRRDRLISVGAVVILVGCAVFAIAMWRLQS